VNWAERQVRRAGRFQQRHAILAVIGLLGLAVLTSTALAVFGTAVASRTEASLLAVAGSALLNFGIFVLAFMVLTAVTQPPLTRAGRPVFQRLAVMSVRRPEERVAAPFTAAAGHDPLGEPRPARDDQVTGPPADGGSQGHRGPGGAPRQAPRPPRPTP
jgi:hypothetical protein